MDSCSINICAHVKPQKRHTEKSEKARARENQADPTRALLTPLFLQPHTKLTFVGARCQCWASLPVVSHPLSSSLFPSPFFFFPCPCIISPLYTSFLLTFLTSRLTSLDHPVPSSRLSCLHRVVILDSPSPISRPRLSPPPFQPYSSFVEAAYSRD